MDPDDRGDALDDDAIVAKLDDLDERFYALEGSMDADAKLNAYLSENPELQS